MDRKLLSILFVIIPLFKPYLLLGINADIVLIVLTCLLFFLLFKWKPARYAVLAPYGLLALYSLFIPPLVALLLLGSGFSVSYLPFFIYAFLSLTIEKLDFSRTFKIYRWAVSICCIFFFVQELAYYAASIRISGLIPYLDVIYAKSWNISTQDYIARQLMINRNSSFFLEPAHFVQYIAPCLIIMLLKKECFNFYYIIMVSSAMLLSRSGNGLLLLAIAFALYLFKTKTKMIWKIIVISSFVSGVLYFSNTQEGEELFARTSELNINNQERHSGFVRVYRGYILWNDLPFLLKVTGIGKNTEEIFENNMQGWMFFGENDRFLNGVQMVLIGNGIIGLIIMFFFLYRMYALAKGDVSKKGLILSLLLLFFVESIFNSSYMVFYISLILCGYKNRLLISQKCIMK